MTMGQSQPLNWRVPEECKAGCEYTVTYDALALQCSDLEPNEISNGEDIPEGTKAILDYTMMNSGYHLLNATSHNRVRDLYTYTLAYLESKYLRYSYHLDELSIYVAGSQCFFYNATYTARVRFTSFSQDFLVLSRDITSDALVKLSNNCTIDVEPLNSTYPIRWPDSNPVASDCLNEYNFMDHFIQVFFETMTGDVALEPYVGGMIYNATYLASSIFNNNGSGIANPNSFELSDMTRKIGLSASLEQAFTNITLSLMSSIVPQDRFVEVTGMVTPHVTEYVYNPIPLMVTYGIALMVVALSSAFALFAMRTNGPQTNNIFSYFIAVTRNKDLDVIDALDEDQPESITLRYAIHKDDEHETLIDKDNINRNTPRFELVSSS
jgi:hypothetical protein